MQSKELQTLLDKHQATYMVVIAILILSCVVFAAVGAIGWHGKRDAEQQLYRCTQQRDSALQAAKDWRNNFNLCLKNKAHETHSQKTF